MSRPPTREFDRCGNLCVVAVWFHGVSCVERRFFSPWQEKWSGEIQSSSYSVYIQCILMYSIQFWCIIFSCIQCVISVSRVSRDCFRFSNLLHTFSVVVRGRRYVLQLQALLVFLLVITATRQTFLMSRIPRLTYLQSESIFQIQPRRDPRATVETLIFFLDIRPG
jgi:hypothetical protein